MTEVQKIIEQAQALKAEGKAPDKAVEGQKTEAIMKIVAKIHDKTKDTQDPDSRAA